MTLAKIQVRGIFRMRDIRLDELQYGGRKPTETSVTDFCYKSENLFFEKLIHIKVILFLIHELFR